MYVTLTVVSVLVSVFVWVGGVIGLPWAQLPWKVFARKVIVVSATAVVTLSFGSLALLWASA